MRKSSFYSILIIVIISLYYCGNPDKTDKSIVTVEIDRPELPPLSEGDIHVTDEVFGKTVELIGTPINLKENIRPYQLLIKDKYLITKNIRADSIIMIFELPDIKCIAAFGSKGIGPEEFISPEIVETKEDSVLCYIYEQTDDKVYKITLNHLSPEYYLTLPKQKHAIGDKYVIFYDSNSAYYVASSGAGKKIFSFHKDSIPQEKVFKDLDIPGIKGSWTTVIGDFGINKDYRRLVYAYKYFKRLRIIDEQSLKEKNLIFDAIDLKKGLNDVATLEPTNITHFWGMSPGNEFFWMLYSGRTPISVQSDNQNNKMYIFVEKYDWNGNPIKRYKLDSWGFFCVDDKRNTLYLAPTAGVHSLIKYDISDSIQNILE